MSEAGFNVSVVCCQHPSCTVRAEGLAEGRNKYAGLPIGWVEVDVCSYRTSGGISSAFGHILTRHYCSVAHLPSELLPEEGP